ncbi:MAG: hypothetical protein DRG87_04690 [Deltaproteobacteria bacterium]|nr:DUF2062 domain-containing protein [Deltaproteobacteria bacterium]MBW2076237.1 DUF2062 domain-containing protein [Deltaproteobacteria bacterium]RLB30589.1 MAG: hypothetical protein DRG87_04690 [Deltaproteobacteria bacterium]
MIKNTFHRRARLLYLRIIRLRGQPHELALGMALGICIGMTPTIPFHMITAVAVAIAFGASKLTAAAGTWICNPVTVYPIYRFCYIIGTSFLGFDHNTGLLMPVIGAIDQGKYLDAIKTILSGGGMAVATFLLGGIVLGLIVSVPSYVLFYYFFKNLAAWRTSRKLIKA